MGRLLFYAGVTRLLVRRDCSTQAYARSSMTTSNETTMKDLAEASAYLEGLINHERSPKFAYARLDLRPIRALLDRLGRPEESLSVIHVAGSKGKGSTCLFTEAILTALGERVGCFTSPHLESWVERFRVGGRSIEASKLVAAVERVRPWVDALLVGPPETRPSFFDATLPAVPGLHGTEEVHASGQALREDPLDQIVGR